MVDGGTVWESLLDALKKFIEEDLKDYRLPIKQAGQCGRPLERPAEVSIMTMPDPDEEHERIPYILLQLLNSKDERGEDGRMKSTVNIRILVTLYNKDKLEGRLQLLYIVQRLRRDMIRKSLIGGCFELEWPLETLIYPDDEGWHHMGEMSTMWSVPSEERFLKELRW